MKEINIKDKKIVYLDQNIWIGLSRVYYEKDENLILKSILDKIIEASNSKNIIFPISIVNARETLSRQNEEQKNRLVDFMIKVSKGYTISPYTEEFKKEEIKQAVLKKIGKPYEDLSKYVIKKGVSNLVGAEGEIIGNIPKNLKNTLLSLVNSEAGLNFILRNPNSKISRNYEEDNKLITELEKMRLENSKIKDNNRRYEEAIAKTVASLLTETQKICSEIGYNKPIFVNIPNSNINNREKVKEEIIQFFQSIRATYTIFVLNYERDSQMQRQINKNDLNDIYSFAMSIPYCDIVVGEKMFIEIAKQSKLNKIYDTILLKSSNISELNKLL